MELIRQVLNFNKMMLVSLQVFKLKLKKLNHKTLTSHLNWILKIHIQATLKFWEKYDLKPIIHWADGICDW